MISAGLVGLACLGPACSFDSPSPSFEGVDAPQPPIDAPIDTPPPTFERVTGGLVAYWRFDEASGDRATDTRGSLISTPPLPAISLPISDPASVTWLGGGLRLDAPVRVGTQSAAHINRDVLASGEVTMEAWVSPAAASQGDGTLPGGLPSYALVLSLSPSYAYHNAMIAQVGDRWQGRVLTELTTANATPVIETPAGAISSTQPVHLVLVASPTERALYVNGAVYRTGPDTTAIGALNKPFPAPHWFDYFPVSIGQERDTLTQKRTWLGTIWLAAVYNRALSEAEIRQNLAARHDCTGC